MTAWTGSLVATVSFNDLTTDSGAPDIGTLHEKLIDSTDGTWISQIDDRTTTCEAQFTIGNTDMVNPVTVNTLDVTVRAALTGTHNDDTLELYAQIIHSDGSTALTNELLYHDAATMSASYVDVQQTHTVLVTDAQEWANNHFKLRWNYNKSKGSDGITLRVSELDFGGDYTGALGLESGHLDNGGLCESVALTSQTHVLTKEDLDATGLLDRQGVGQTHVLTSYDLEGWGEIESVTMISEHVLTADAGLNNGGGITSGAVLVTFKTTSQDLSGLGGITSGPLAVTHALATLPALGSFHEIEEVAMPTYERMTWPNVQIAGDSHLLAIEDFGNEGLIQTGAIDTAHETLAADDFGNGGVIQSGQISATHMLAVTELDATGLIESVALVDQRHLLACEHLDGIGEIESVAMTGNHVLATEDLDSIHLIQPVTLETLVIVPTYPNLNHYVDDNIIIDLSTGWGNHDPNGFTVDVLPAGLVMSAQGVVTGTPTTVQDVYPTVSNSGFDANVFRWRIIERTISGGEAARENQQHLGIFINIGVI